MAAAWSTAQLPFPKAEHSPREATRQEESPTFGKPPPFPVPPSEHDRRHNAEAHDHTNEQQLTCHLSHNEPEHATPHSPQEQHTPQAEHPSKTSSPQSHTSQAPSYPPPLRRPCGPARTALRASLDQRPGPVGSPTSKPKAETCGFSTSNTLMPFPTLRAPSACHSATRKGQMVPGHPPRATPKIRGGFAHADKLA